MPPEHSTRFCVAAATAGVGCTYRQVRREGHFEVLEPTSVSWGAVRTALQQAGVLRGSGGDDAAPEAAPDLSPAVPGSVMATTTRTETADEVVFVTRRAALPTSSL